MREFIAKIKPANGFSQVVHLSLVTLLPLLVFILVQIGFFQLALAIILLSKWRMLAVRPRYWLANIRANGVDVMVGVSILVFMIHAPSVTWRLAWAVGYAFWLIWLKPKSGALIISLQAILGQLCGLIALFIVWPTAPLYVLVASSGVICYVAARHFFDSFEEPYSKLLSYTWGYFAAALVWLMGHWLLFYGFLAQPTLLLTVTSYGLAALYYLDHHDKLSKLVRREFIFIMIAIVAVILISLWQSTKSKIV
jgi:hypothetical protein